MVDTGRKRVTFDPDDDIWKIVQPQGRRARKEYLNEAVRRYHSPAFRYVVPSDPNEADLSPLIRGARQEMIFVGTSLLAFAEQYRDVLDEKLAERVTMTFVTLHPGISEDDSVYGQMAIRLGAHQFVEDLRAQLQTSTSIFRELRSAGLRQGAHVRVLGCREVLTCGLAIADPQTHRSPMRVTLYPSMRLRRISPFFEIDPRSTEGDLAYREYLSYYQHVAERAQAILDPEVI
jgi:hypothetical protein